MLEILKIEGTRSSPQVFADPSARRLTLTGESYPENTFEFYRPLVAWVHDLVDLAEHEDGQDAARTPITLDVALSYMNTGSIKSVMDILDRLDEAHGAGIEVAVLWRCDAENERAIELAEELLEDMSLPYQVISE